MFKNIEPLAKENHQDLRYNSINSFDFARNVSNVPISTQEFILSSKYYPILFAKNQPQAIIILSFENGNNDYLNEDCTWRVPYIPAYFRRYPFIFAKNQTSVNESDKENYVLCIDRDAPHFSLPYGDLMFTANGEPAQLVLNTLDFLKSYHEDLAMTEVFIKALEEKKLLVERPFEIVRNGKKTLVGGFMVIDTVKLNSLDDSVIADWVRKGLMMLIFAHISSLTNLSPLSVKYA